MIATIRPGLRCQRAVCNRTPSRALSDSVTSCLTNEVLDDSTQASLNRLEWYGEGARSEKSCHRFVRLVDCVQHAPPIISHEKFEAGQRDPTQAHNRWSQEAVDMYRVRLRFDEERKKPKWTMRDCVAMEMMLRKYSELDMEHRNKGDRHMRIVVTVGLLTPLMILLSIVALVRRRKAAMAI